MFKKLKDKIAEEVKQSPLKSVQQLAQAVVSPSSSSVFEPTSSNDKFCIEEGDIEEDERQEQAKPGGFTSVTLTGQTSSPVRDQNQRYGFRSSSGSLVAEADNLFPKFEPQPTNFHVQSDWESASEVEDRYSQLEHINKESLYEAYRKVYNRYNKMKNKYHEVVTHYRQLEREKEKAKTVLTETQDKALLRISELREQCLLEQQAKAHLEEALRNELEERDHIINTLKTKVQYLKGISDNSAIESLDVSNLSKEEGNLIDFTENLSVSTVPLPFDASCNEDKINWFEEKLKTLKKFLNEETTKFEHLRNKLKETKNHSFDLEDANLESEDGNQLVESVKKTENELSRALSDLVVKLTTEVHCLKKNAVHCSLIKSVNDKVNLETDLTEDSDENFTSSKNKLDVQRNEMSMYTSLIKQLEDQIKILSQKLHEENFIVKELKNELNSCNTVTDVLKRKIKLSNEHFGKNDAINCLITDVDNELIQEWNLCFQNFLQTRCEITVLKDTREDLEKELLRIKEEKNELEKYTEEITEKHTKLKGDLDIFQKDIKSYIAQLDTLSKESNNLKGSNENLEKQIKKLEETLSHSEKVYNERQDDLQKVIEEKKISENKLCSLELELQTLKSEHSFLLEANKNLDFEVLCFRKENSDLITEKESLNNKVNDVENKLKQFEEEYKTVLDTRDRLDNQLMSLTKETEEFSSEKSTFLSKVSCFEKDIENCKLENSLLLEEKENLLEEMQHIKDKYELITREKLSITERFHDLVDELESNKHNYSKSLEYAKKQSDELVYLKEERDELTKENCALLVKIENLNKDIENFRVNSCLDEEVKQQLLEELSSIKEDRDNLLCEIKSFQNRIVELNSASKAANEELSLIKKRHAELSTEKSIMQEEIQRLEESLKFNEENYSLSEVSTKLSEELQALQKERDELFKEKVTLESQSKVLANDLTNSKEECLSLSKEYGKISKELQTLKREHQELVSGKESERELLKKIENNLKENEGKLLLTYEENKKFSDEIETLRNEFDQIEKEHKLLQGRYNSVNADYEKSKEFTVSLTEMKDRLSDEVDSLKRDYETASNILSKTKAQLEIQQNTNSELKDQLCSLSEALKNKSVETDEKYQENLCLKDENKELLEKINVSNSQIEKCIKEKDFILNYLIGNLNSVKIIKELQKNLYDFVKQFQVEISREISDINMKMGHDLLKHLNDLLDPETYGAKFELECRSKKDIDSYNSKLKNLHGATNISEEVMQAKFKDLEGTNSDGDELISKMVEFKRLGQLEKSSEIDGYIPCKQNEYNPEVYLKQAISLMKSFTNLLNHNTVGDDYLLNDIFGPLNLEKCIKLSEIEGNNLQKEIVAMELFITDYESKYNEADSSRVSFNEFDEMDNNVGDHDNSSALQLRQELRLKEDIIKKLQSVIEDYEQKKDCDDSESVNRQKIYMLEQENKSLLLKLEQVQETHESNMKNLISEYEKKVAEIEEDKNIYDFEKLDNEKRYVVNEMKEQIQNLQQDLEERGDAFEKLYEEHQHSMKNLDEEIHQLRNNHDKELREQDKKWRQCLDRRLAEEETRHQQELTSLNMQWNAERRELETARRLAVNAVESGSGSNDLLRRQVQALTLQLAELRNSRCESCDWKRRIDEGKEHRPRSIQDCTEMEYLRNILYEYMMGKEPLVLAKVLCALVKFDENQTKEIVSKEEHRITLFGQLGLL